MKKMIFPIILLIAVSCNNEGNKSTDPLKQTTWIPGQQCFSYTTDKDTILLHLHVFTDSVNGDLSYNFYEKDKSNGTIHGHAHGDTIFADYTFRSEGSESLREVVFLRKDSTLIDGGGEMEDAGGKMIFKNKNALNFNTGLVLKRSNCN